MHRYETPGAPTAWTLVTPLKPLARAKSRLSAAAGEDLRPELALAFAQDTVAAALACPVVRSVVVVTDDPLAAAELSAQGARIVPDPSPGPGTDPSAGPRTDPSTTSATNPSPLPGTAPASFPGNGNAPGQGLNAALSHGAAAVRQLHPQAAVAAINADLPALRPGELARVLCAAARFPRAFLPDAHGIGTTVLSALPGVALAPAFGGASRARHAASGAAEITVSGVDSVRRDVDTGQDLVAALALGVGPRTAHLTSGFCRSC